MLLRLALACASAQVLSLPAAGAEDPLRLETIEVAGLRATSLADRTASVSVLTEEDLAVRLSPNPADQLRAVPGLSVSRAGGVSGLTQVRLRGAEANHTLVLFEGIDISDPVNGEADFATLTVLPVARIEVLRGAGSSLHGSDAIGGVISLVAEREGGLTGMAEAGSFGSMRAGIGHTGELFGAGISGFSTEGVDTSGREGGRDGAGVLSGLVTARFFPQAGWSGSFIGLVRSSDVDFDSDADFDGRLDDTDTRTRADFWLAGVSVTGVSGPVDHVIRASVSEVERRNFRDGSRTDAAHGQRSLLSWSPGFSSGGHSVAGLVELERETYRRTDVAFGGLTNAEENLDSVSLAAEYRLAAGATDLAASARFSSADGLFKEAVTWHFGAGYTFEQSGARLHVAAGSGIKNPTFTEMFGFFPGSFVGNPSLRPEQSVSHELGWTQTVGRLSYSATWFEADLQDEIYTAFNPDFTATVLNRTEESRRRGTELTARWAPGGGITVSGQATLLESKDNAGRDEIRVPDQTFSLSVDWQGRPDGIRLALAGDHVGEQADTDFGSFPARSVRIDAYTLVSLTADYPLTETIGLTIRGENLLGHKQTDVFGYRGPGAGVFVGFSLR